MGREPLRLKVQRRRQRENVWIGGLFQIRDAGTGGDKGAAGIDLLDEIVAAHVDLLGRSEVDRRGIVDADVDAPEALGTALDRRGDTRLVPHIHDERQRLTASAFNRLRGAIDGTGQLRVRLRGLGGDRDAGTIARGAQGDGEPDAAAGAGYE